jgi:hypothetical protein
LAGNILSDLRSHTLFVEKAEAPIEGVNCGDYRPKKVVARKGITPWVIREKLRTPP